VECDFIEKEINYNKALKIIDIGCGTGCHSTKLSKSNYTMTEIDLSESLLEKVKEKEQIIIQIAFSFIFLSGFLILDLISDMDGKTFRFIWLLYHTYLYFIYIF
jgi:2-polyprenyl-3-methyl-5-hydroxy-6-metoxy-1,4-benzoquinol methylase